jgi:hypothetical protein
MLTSQNGIREFHSGPKYGRIEIGDHKPTNIDRGRDLATQEISENSIARRKRVRLSRPNPRPRLHLDGARMGDFLSCARHGAAGAARILSLRQNTFNCPTLAEAYKIAGLDAWNRMTR